MHILVRVILKIKKKENTKERKKKKHFILLTANCKIKK
jgi:hypothetical protein